MKNGGYRIMKSILAWVNGLSLTSKIVAAVVAGAVVVGGVATAVIVTNSGSKGAADTGALTSSTSESLTAETNGSVARTAESETPSVTEESSSTAASSQSATSSQKPNTTPSSQAPTTPSSSAPTTPQPAAFAVYINGKAVDLGTVEKITKKMTIHNVGADVKKEINGDAYADAGKLVAALGLKQVSDKVKEDIGRRASTENVLLVEKKQFEDEYGVTITWFAIVEGSNAMAMNSIGYDHSGERSGEGYDADILGNLANKMVSGKLYTPVSLVCELLGYRYEYKDAGLYITK
jgi:hypothetical protein